MPVEPSSVYNSVDGLATALRENRQLRAEIEQLRAENERLLAENEQLRELSYFSIEVGYAETRKQSKEQSDGYVMACMKIDRLARAPSGGGWLEDRGPADEACLPLCEVGAGLCFSD